MKRLAGRVAVTMAVALMAGQAAAADLEQIYREALAYDAALAADVESASLALGFSEQLRHVILPQAVKIATPPTVGFMVQIVKNTSLASAIGFVELARAGQIINNSTFEPFVIFVIVAMLYFALCYPLSVLSRRLERSFHVAHR